MYYLAHFKHIVILGQDPKVEQFTLIGYTLHKYIWNKNTKLKGFDAM